MDHFGVKNVTHIWSWPQRGPRQHTSSAWFGQVNSPGALFSRCGRCLPPFFHRVMSSKHVSSFYMFLLVATIVVDVVWPSKQRLRALLLLFKSRFPMAKQKMQKAALLRPKRRFVLMSSIGRRNRTATAKGGLHGPRYMTLSWFLPSSMSLRTAWGSSCGEQPNLCKLQLGAFVCPFPFGMGRCLLDLYI